MSNKELALALAKEHGFLSVTQVFHNAGYGADYPYKFKGHDVFESNQIGNTSLLILVKDGVARTMEESEFEEFIYDRMPLAL